MTAFPADVRDLVAAYYEDYYRKSLGLPDWRQRIESRHREEELFAAPVIGKLERALNFDFRGKRVLVVGAGTGAELFHLHAKGAEAYALEPNPDAVRILARKAELRGLDPSRIVEGYAEAMPWPDGAFDFVYCYTVLEHVQDVGKCLDEMVRICAPGGAAFLEMPNYAMPYEPHYKIFMPTFLPRALQKLYLRLRRRPPGFLDSLNYVRPGFVLGHLRHRGITCLRILDPYAPSYARTTNYMYQLGRAFGIERDLWLVACKPAAPSGAAR